MNDASITGSTRLSGVCSSEKRTSKRLSILMSMGAPFVVPGRVETPLDHVGGLPPKAGKVT